MEALPVLDFPTVAKLNLENLGKLGAFTNKNVCQYNYGDGTHCAIGLALGGGSISVTHNNVSVSGAVVGKLFNSATKDYHYLVLLQDYHDNMCGGEKPRNRRMYTRFINKLLKEYNNEKSTTA